ncbi:hypothetical protein yaldo0001_16730 [Yersinia aldovae ATCC 35236]|nr:hypothetical protein yaldo0001_16730 [Yersinia aldovae ATCC 35236]
MVASIACLGKYSAVVGQIGWSQSSRKRSILPEKGKSCVTAT